MPRPRARAAFLATALFSLGLGVAPAAAKEAGPNLLIIYTDEHNFRTLGCYRALLPNEQAFMWGKDAVVTTPHIDWLAEKGAVCTSFYATTPVCSPSRSSFVSGRYPHRTPVVNNNIPLDDEIITFAEILRRQGYATGYAGKWHLDGQGKPQWEPERRFGFTDNRFMFNRGHWKKMEDMPSGRTTRPAVESWSSSTRQLMISCAAPGMTRGEYPYGLMGGESIESHAIKEKLFGAKAIVAVAGMEGALPSVVVGLVGCPVVAVPTYVGYGASFQGADDADRQRTIEAKRIADGQDLLANLQVGGGPELDGIEQLRRRVDLQYRDVIVRVHAHYTGVVG